MKPDLIVAKVDRARMLLSEARDAKGAKQVADMARAAEIYARRQKLSEEAIVYATGVKVEAMAMMGDFLRVTEKNKGTKGQLVGRGKIGGSLKAPPITLQQSGITKKESVVAQTLASVRRETPEVFDELAGGKRTITQVVRERKEANREKERVANARKVEGVKGFPKGAFATVVIDPPWDWGDEGDVNQMGRAKPDYATMSMEKLLALPVGDLAAQDAHIYLWITNRSLPKGFALLERWGFRYVTMLTWVKPSFGLGNYFRGQTEQVLFGVRGSLPLKRKDVGTVFHAERGRGHSAKPESFLELVESCSHAPWLEMFSRHERKGWKAWGENG